MLRLHVGKAIRHLYENDIDMKRTTKPTNRPKYKPRGSPGDKLRRAAMRAQMQVDRSLSGQLQFIQTLRENLK